ncbi:hypothetical protein [Paenibacillus solani]|uniref:Uncharacterized protein n=1 Tax=Paenibacillus solani TaxID=1705565 RepID=A0A0M1P8A3_9BACL|nr:hypothetical protein [Paenibacillus solani]KOR90254.1 hypothetical protein AM231_14670 [Paenibacillus solani]
MDFISSDEGELFWIHKNELLNLHTSKLITFSIEQYLENPDRDDILVVTVTANHEAEPLIRWTTMKETVTF